MDHTDFKIGDEIIVNCEHWGFNFENAEGIIRAELDGEFGVEFINYNKIFHSLNQRCDLGYGWWISNDKFDGEQIKHYKEDEEESGGIIVKIDLSNIKVEMTKERMENALKTHELLCHTNSLIDNLNLMLTDYSDLKSFCIKAPSSETIIKRDGGNTKLIKIMIDELERQVEEFTEEFKRI